MTQGLPVAQMATEVTGTARRKLALAGAHAHPGRIADVAHRAPAVVPPARLLQPVQVEVGDPACEADRLLDGPSLVRVGSARME
jgi:hypothetical protein